jgi:hypothetical protein
MLENEKIEKLLSILLSYSKKYNDILQILFSFLSIALQIN